MSTISADLIASSNAVLLAQQKRDYLHLAEQLATRRIDIEAGLPLRKVGQIQDGSRRCMGRPQRQVADGRHVEGGAESRGVLRPHAAEDRDRLVGELRHPHAGRSVDRIRRDYVEPHLGDRGIALGRE